MNSKGGKNQQQGNWAGTKQADPFTSSELASTSPSAKVSERMKMTKEEMLQAFAGKDQVNKLRKPLNCPMEKDKPCACLLQNISSRDCPYGKQRKQTPTKQTTPQGKTVSQFKSLKGNPKQYVL